jgi:hypothetical protein
MLYLKFLEKQEQIKHKTRRNGEKIKIRAKIKKKLNEESRNQKCGSLKK